MTSKKNDGKAFENNVAQVLRLREYSVTANVYLAGTQVDLIARKNDLLEEFTFAVECGEHDRPVGIGIIKENCTV